jgi:hypothetical protein
MTKPLPFRVVRKGTSFTAYGLTPDRVLSQHRTIETAQRAFDRITGAAVLIGPEGSTLNHRIV